MAEVQSSKSCIYTENKQKGWYKDRNFILGLLVFLATGSAAVFTGYQAWIAKDTAERQLRAYVMSRPDYVFAFNQTIPVSMRYTLTNHGQTPAYELTNVSIVDILPYPLPMKYIFSALPPLPESTLTLHPNAPLDGFGWATRTFSQNDIDKALANNGVRIYVFGLVEYRHAFRNLRWTKFCSSVVGNEQLAIVAKGIPGPTIDLRFEPSRQHNEAT